jgi:hypothetical protein
MSQEEGLPPYAKMVNGKLIVDENLLPPLRDLIREEYGVVHVRHHEDDFMHILMPLEETALMAYRADRSVSNHDVKTALKELRDRLPEPPAGQLAAAMHARLRLAAALNPQGISDAEIKACIDRVLESVKQHGGRHEYLAFLDQVMP